MKTMDYEIETDVENGTVTIISDDDDILNDGEAMESVSAEVRRVFGPGAETIGRGCSFFDERGREAGWTWDAERAECPRRK